MTRVLIVDDNELVRNMSDLVLRQHGFDTVVADSAATGLEQLELGPIDAIVTDLTMPGELDGADLVRRVRDERPGIGIVVTTGYTVHPSTFDDAVVVLGKPFGIDQLVAAVEQVLPRT